ncbi:hypothetical protein BTR23_11845 [Alkalihalophilus pseudofirmus]|nr:hypothetical protein BTR23_11845 [Alkalihalophilus pseudofirmus]
MNRDTQEKVDSIFKSIEIVPEYSSRTLKIDRFTWNGDMEDFIVVYFVGPTKFTFHYNDEIANELGIETKKNPVQQLELEVNYLKRMYERGIGSKEYYPFTS